jgi:hypothetical protein
MRGGYGQPSRWTPERVAEAIALDPAWLGPEVSGWSQGWAAVQLAPGRRTTLDVIRYESGAEYWGGRAV